MAADKLNSCYLRPPVPRTYYVSPRCGKHRGGPGILAATASNCRKKLDASQGPNNNLGVGAVPVPNTSRGRFNEHQRNDGRSIPKFHHPLLRSFNRSFNTLPLTLTGRRFLSQLRLAAEARRISPFRSSRDSRSSSESNPRPALGMGTIWATG